MSEQHAEDGVIVETPSQNNGYRYVIKGDSGRRYDLWGLGAPMGGNVGDRGRVKFQTGAGYGLYFWTSEATP